MVPLKTVEVFDPLIGNWILQDKQRKVGRSYFAVTLLDNKTGDKILKVRILGLPKSVSFE